VVSRYPNALVRQKLRKEANFGCPICGSPYLSWHHFDPPWHIEQHHRPEGMIGLCRVHHDQADDGRYTKEQLLGLKKNPIIDSNCVSEEYGYLRRNTVCRIGSSLGYGTKYILMIDEQPVIWFELDENGYDRLNLFIRDAQGNVILSMENNDWVTPIRNLFDIECSTRGRTLKVVSKDGRTNFELRFDDLSIEEFKRKFLELGYTEAAIDEFVPKIVQDIKGRISMWTLMGSIVFKDKTLKITEDKIIFAGISISNSIAVYCDAFFKVSEFDFAMGCTSSPITSLQRQQRRAVAVREIELTELENLADDTPIYKRAGLIYFAANKNQLLENLKGIKEAF
jgi:hypothetical protein